MANKRTVQGNRKRKSPKPPKAPKVLRANKPARDTASKARRHHRGHEILGVVGLGAAIFLVLSLLSLQFQNGSLMGPFGRAFAVLGYSLFGIAAYGVAVLGAVLAVRLLMEKPRLASATQVLGTGLGLLCLDVLLHLIGKSYRVAGYGPGGLLGEHIGSAMQGVASTAGTALFAVIGVMLALVIATPLRMRTLLGFVGLASAKVGQGALTGAKRVGTDAAKFSGEVIRAVLPERDHDEYLDEYDDEYDYDDEEDIEENAATIDPPIIDSRSGAVAAPEIADQSDTEKVDASHLQALTEEAAAEPAKKSRRKKKTMIGVGDTQPPSVVALAPATEAATATKTAAKAEEPATEIAAKTEPAVPTGEPVIVESEFKHVPSSEMKKKEAEAEGARLDFIPLQAGEYKLPSLNLLNYDDAQTDGVDRAAMLELSARLVRTLENYGVKGQVSAIRPGPVVTMYEFAPAPGTRLNKIVNLADDLAMALEAMKVRIVAPIPGKAAVGIEVPNKSREMVYLKEIIADKSFRSDKIKLPMALGKTIEGAPTTVDLAKMPHLLVAGTTGSGKSVSVNSIITSLLYKSTPEEVRMIMIDPKMLELSIYEGVPHLLLPVVTDPKKANLAMRWAVDEMERRYELLAKMGVRDISTYNKKLAKKRGEWKAQKLQNMADEARRMAEDGDLDEAVEVTEERQAGLPFGEGSSEPPRELPYIVIIIDEFADLMMCAPKEVETSVARIAQKARAAGIHLILATQRPSVDVITGLIKANFPSRVAFRVSSKVDSRTILDQSGAENLLGSGDMLFCDRGAAPERLHGCYVDEDEIHRVVDFLKKQAKPVYNLDIIKPRDDEEGDGEGGDALGEEDNADGLYDKAVQIVAESQRVSVSYIQRRLSVGYNRAAKMVERMEREGIVSPPDNKKQREVLISAA